MLAVYHRFALRAYRLLPSMQRRQVLRLLSPTFTVGALCLVERDDGRILLVHHSYRPGWGLPGGIVKRREQVDDAARREVREEVAIEVDLIGRPFVVVEPMQQRVDIVFSARPGPAQNPDDARIASPEIVEVRWFAIYEINELHENDELQVEAISALSARSLLTDSVMTADVNRARGQRMSPKGIG